MLCTIGLHPHTVLNHTVPIHKSGFIDSIDIVRDNEGTPHKGFRYFKPFKRMPRALGKFFRILSLTREEQYDVYCGIFHIPHGLSAVIASKLYNKPSIVSLIGYHDHNPKMIHFDTPFLGNIMLWIISRADIITVTGRTTRRYFMEKGVNPRKIHIIPNAIEYKGGFEEERKRPIDILFLGRVVPEKNVLLSIDVVRELKRYYPKIQMAIVGDGRQAKAVKKYIQKLGLGENIKLYGWQSNTEEFYKRAKVFILNSRSEGVPFAQLEAMMYGAVPVVPSVGDIQDVIKNGVEGILVDDYKDVKRYTLEIRKLLEDKKEWERLSKASMARAGDFSYDKIAEYWRDAIEVMMEPK